MMKKKRILALMLAASMSLGLAACGGGTSESPAGNTDTPSGNTPSGSGETVELTIWTYPIGKFGDYDTMQALIDEYTAANPGVSIKFELLDYTNGDTQVTSAITSGTAPDIIMEGPERLVTNWGANNLMVDLSDLWTEEATADIAATSEAVVNACQLDGKYYEYPLCMTTHCMAINYEVFEQAGALQYIDEETRTWTTDNFVKAMEAVRDSGLVAVPGIVYCGGQGGDQGTRALVNNLYSGTYTNADHTEYTANSPENVKALELIKSMVDNGSLNANAGFQAADELQQFANGTAAVTFCWNASNKAQYASQVAFTPYAMAFPSDDGVPELDGGIWGFGIFDNGDQARIDASKTFIDWVCNSDEAANNVYNTTFFPVRSSLGDVYAGTDKASFSDFLIFMPYLGDYYAVTPKWSEQRTAWFEMLQSAFSNGDAAAALAEYDATANA